MKNKFDCLKNTMMGMTYEEVEDAVKNRSLSVNSMLVWIFEDILINHRNM